MTNDVSANAIIAMSIGSNGMLSGGSMTATSGNGGNLIGADGKPDFPDALSVQDSVASAGNVSDDCLLPQGTNFSVPLRCQRRLEYPIDV